MKEKVPGETTVTPMLFPYEPGEFWQTVRQVIREEITKAAKETSTSDPACTTPGLTYKPLYKIMEVCEMFQVTKTTIYGWIKCGKLKPYKVRSRVYFLHNDIQQMFTAA